MIWTFYHAATADWIAGEIPVHYSLAELSHLLFKLDGVGIENLVIYKWSSFVA